MVDQVVDNYREHILDGIVIETADRDLRFVDAPEVGRTAERGVTLDDRTPTRWRSCRRRRAAPGRSARTSGPGVSSKLLGRAWKRD